jgi:hypothetical protein
MLPFKMTLSEKLATIIRSRQSGNLGTYEDMGFGRGKVIADGITILVSGNSRCCIIGVPGSVAMRSVNSDAELEYTIELALGLNHA